MDKTMNKPTDTDKTDVLATLERLLEEATDGTAATGRVLAAVKFDVALCNAAPALLEIAKSLDEILNYSGGADNALEDEYVMDRATTALRALDKVSL